MQRSLFVLSFALLLATVSWAQVVPMTNDECSTATSVFDGVNPNAPVGASGNVFTNVGATASPAAPRASPRRTWTCGSSTSRSRPGRIRIETCTPAGFAAAGLADTVLSVLDGSVCPAVTSLACNDDTCGSCGLLSRVTACFTAGAPYYIRVSGFGGSSGNFYLNIVAAPPAVLPNDDCAGAIALATGPNGPFSNTGAANSCVAASCGFGGSPGYQDVWFSYVPTCSGNLTIDTGCTAGLDTILTAYAACGGPELGCNDDAGGSCGLNSSITVPATAGSPVLIRVSSYANGTTGSFPINILPGGGMAVGFSSPFGPRLDPDRHHGWAPERRLLLGR